MFIVTPAGVIATDPISERRPAKPYIDAIQAVTKAPIKYVIYSHSHFDHIAGGKPFKDLGATFVAQRNAKARIQALKPDDVVMPDQVVDDKRIITLGGTTLELLYVGKNHSDSMLVMRLPKEKIIFTVDWIPIQGVQFRGMADTYVPDIEDGLKKVIAMDWETLIPGHPGPGGKQIGTKDNARDQLAYLQDLSAAVKKEVREGKSYDDAVKEITLPKYASVAELQGVPAHEYRALLRFLEPRHLTGRLLLWPQGDGVCSWPSAAVPAGKRSRQLSGAKRTPRVRLGAGSSTRGRT